ncbi:MAG: endolytic transglycosylase MltG [Gemmatimonadaceae bacterium]|nr:endolytic transglycosylase MltG [Gemmatimonadaceae bacterium]
MTPKRNRKRSRTTRLILLAAGIVLGAGLMREVRGSNTPDGSATRVVIPRGASMRAAADSLAAHDVIGSTRMFRWYASLTGNARDIKPGTYLLPPGAGYATVLDALVNGKGVMATVVIPEGFDLRDIAPALAKALDVPEDSVQAAVTDTAWVNQLNIPVPSLEGYLFPATYSFPEGTTAREAVNAMVERFLEMWKPEYDIRLQAMSISRHDAMAMASIVEKEARKPEERAIISAVYWNRVKAGMLLQADPTVQYALPRHVGRVLYKDLEVESKYNTYKHVGLPPGPIASPGVASIEAALSPADVPYLFFVARADGGHEFTRTFEEHTKAIAQIKADARAQRRASGSAEPKGSR